MNNLKFSRTWAIPNSDTFNIKPINDFVLSYLSLSKISVDMFARNNCLSIYNNDLDFTTKAEYHMDAEVFLKMLYQKEIKADLIIFDPPYSPRQISECYKKIGLNVGMKETQNAALYKRVKDAIIPICSDNAIVLSFGWNSCGMGKNNGFEQIEIMLCAHGGAHNDTICVAEQKIS